MADKERYIDADKLKTMLEAMYVGMPQISVPYNSYGNASMDAALANMINNQVVTAMNTALWSFKAELAKAIDACATLKGTPCFLCKQRDGEELPEEVRFNCPGKAAVGN